MRFLVSGEGPTDMGYCDIADPCDGVSFKPGPMAWIVDQIAEATLGYSFIEISFMRYVSETGLSSMTKTMRPRKLPGKRLPRETAGYYKAARALAKHVHCFTDETEDEVIGVLFRDADGTQSAGRGHWQDKWDAMELGFSVEDCTLGVPMLPMPKSEAWLICALKPNQPYQHCDSIEQESGNDRSPNSLKKQLKLVLGEDANRELLAEKLLNREVDISRITMPSFVAFRERLESVLEGED